MPVPAGPYAWLNAEAGPLMLREALKLYGVLEAPGAADNPQILAWADELGARLGTKYATWAAGWYLHDAIPWCGLFMALVAQRANPDDRPERRPPSGYLAAKSWATWGAPTDVPMLGDVLVFGRDGGGHVAEYIGEDASAYFVLGANQGDLATGRKADTVGVARLGRDRLLAARRAAYRVQPANVRPITLAASGRLSTNEA